MKKYIIALVAVLVVAAIGIYFGNPDLFQGKMFPFTKQTTGSALAKYNLCLTPEELQKDYEKRMAEYEKEQEQEKLHEKPSTTTPPDTTTTTTTEEETNKPPVIDPNKNVTTGKSQGTYSVNKEGNSTGINPTGGNYTGESSKNYTYEVIDCGCKRAGKVTEKTDSEGKTIVTTCRYYAKWECLPPKSPYLCPRGTQLNYNGVRDLCIDSRKAQCFGTTKPAKEAVEICAIYEDWIMAIPCTHSCNQEIWELWASLKDTDAVAKAKNITAGEVKKLMGECSEQTIMDF
ncbi:hypothetical protein M0P48_02995 [Candidatus Gracilibacteria bacterium]|nr:hypothetical protein [Candidatus Gracilibacteria bacterium]